MTHAQSTAYKLRWLLLAVALLCILGGVLLLFAPALEWPDFSAGILGTPLMIPGIDLDGHEPGFYINTLIVLGLCLLMHWLFLRPRKGWSIRLSQTGRPMATSVIAAAFMAMLLTIGLAASFLEMPGWWRFVGDKGDDGGPGFIYGVRAAMIIAWIGWGIVFFVYWRQGDRYTQLGRMIRGLIAGSILELIVAVPVQVFSPRRKECYCATGSYTGIVFGTTVLLWAFGPGIVLLFLREKQRREKLDGGEPGAD